MSMAGSSKQEMDEEENLVWFTASNSIKEPKKEQMFSPPDLSKEKFRRERPRFYKVQETPALNEDGIRECSFCQGQPISPFFNSNFFRWRCGNKTCRKWYGWVREGDEVPMNMNRKGRPNGIYESFGIQRMKRSRTSTEESLPPTLTPISPLRYDPVPGETEDDEMGDEEEFQMIPDEEDDLIRGLEFDPVKGEEYDAEYYPQDKSFVDVHIKNEL